LYVNSNSSWKVTVQSDWLHTNVTEGTGSRNVVVEYDSNYLEDGVTPAVERTGTIRFSVEGAIPSRITVKQGARTFKNPVFQPMPDPYVWREDDGSSGNE